jgi:alkylated DNA repair dioxygenase AlkB
MMNCSLNLLPFDGEMYYFPGYFDAQDSDLYFKELMALRNWRQDEIRIFGKKYFLPRRQMFLGDSEDIVYTYSGIKLNAQLWPDFIMEIKNRIEHDFNIIFNSALVNLYRDGNDSNGKHSDDEPEMGKNPVMASVSLGASRKFRVYHKTQKHCKTELTLRHGDLVIMKGEMQHHWYHEIPKEKKVLEPRINITFRKVYASPFR